MEQLEHAAQTYDQALDEALDLMQRDLEEVDVEVLSDGKDGGPVRLRLVLRDTALDEAQDWLLDVLDAMDLDCSVGIIFEADGVTLHIETDDDAGMLIGRKGQTLDALQYLLNVAYGPRTGRRLHVDVHDYRKRHHEKLIEMAQEVADRVRSTGRSVRMLPMNAADRKVVHNELQAFGDLETGSQGDDPNRFVVVHPRREGGRTGGYGR